MICKVIIFRCEIMFILRVVIHMPYMDATAIIELIQLPKQHCIQIDEYVFLRPQ